jgi:hypothetical protein
MIQSCHPYRIERLKGHNPMHFRAPQPCPSDNMLLAARIMPQGQQLVPLLCFYVLI